MFQTLRDLAMEDSTSFSFGGRLRTFYVLNIPNRNISRFQQRVRALPVTPTMPPPQLGSMHEGVTNMFEDGGGSGKRQFDSPTGIAIDRNGDVLVAETTNGRLEKFSSTGTFLSNIGTKGTGPGQLGAPTGIAIDRAGDIYVADAGNHRVLKLTADGTVIAEWKDPAPGFYGPQRIPVGPDASVYVVDQDRSRIAKFSPDERAYSGSGAAKATATVSLTIIPLLQLILD